MLLKETLFLLCVILSISLVGCRAEETTDEVLKVVVTLSFFQNLVEEVGGDTVHVTALIPVGVEPEEYDPLPRDMQAIENAQLFFYNGLDMERWLPRILPDLHEKEMYIPLAHHDAIEAIPIPEGPFAGEPDPHVWTDVQNVILYVETITEALISVDREHKEQYRTSGEQYVKQLEHLHQWITEKVELLPPEHRILMTSELCFQYFARAYGFRHDAIWPINAPEEGSPQQIINMVEKVREWNPQALFVENQVDHRPMEQVSRETGIPIGPVLFSDSLGHPGEGGETYVDMMKDNTRRMVEALGGKEEMSNASGP